MKSICGTRLHVLAAVIGCMLMTSAVGYGQMTQGQVEATGQLGLVGGIGTHASIGGSAGVAYRERIFLQGELSYIPLGGGSVSILNVESEGSAKSINFNGGAQFLFPRSGTVAPYAGAGLGVTHTSSNVSTSVGGVTSSFSASSNDLYLNFGGGVRYHMNDRWGFKPELMIFAGSETYIRVAVGIFFQFGN